MNARRRWALFCGWSIFDPKDSRLSQAVVKATVTTGAKPHGQQQLARDLEVERAVMGQRCRPQSFGEVQRCLYSSSTSNERTEEMGTFLWLIDF